MIRFKIYYLYLRYIYTHTRRQREIERHELIRNEKMRDEPDLHNFVRAGKMRLNFT